MGEEVKDAVVDSALESANELGQEVSAWSTYLQQQIPHLMDLGIRILVSIVIFLIGRVLIRWIRHHMRKVFEKKHADLGVVQFTDSMLKFALYFLLAMIVVTNLGVSLSSLTALFAGAGVGITMALQDTLANFAGGILILMLKPFKVGDYIIVEAGKVEGTVQEIRTFYTKLATIDTKVVVIPNGKLTNDSLTNMTAESERQLDIKVSISYESDLRKAKKLLEEILLGNPKIMTGTREWLIFVDSLGDSGVVLGVRAWAKKDDYWPIRWALLEQIKLTFDEEGIVIPYPQVSVHMHGHEMTVYGVQR